MLIGTTVVIQVPTIGIGKDMVSVVVRTINRYG